MSDKPKDPDALEIRIRIPSWFCKVCGCTVFDPENHRFHAVVNLEQIDPEPKERP